MPRISPIFALVLCLSPPRTAHAQPPSGPPVHVERRSTELAGGTIAHLATRWTPDATTSGTSLALGDAAPSILARGASAATIERGERVTVIAYEAFDGRAPFRLRVVRHEANHDVLSDEQMLARPGTRDGDVPFSVAIAPIPGRGFAVFFEEVQGDDPSATRTYLFQLDLDGEPLDTGREIAIPWPIAAVAWNGHGYHLALIYPGSGSGLRLSMVSLSAEGVNQQHPDWSSSAGFVDDVHLVSSGDHIHAHYRGGSGGDHWLESDVTAIRHWGSEPPAAIDHGRLEADVTLAVDPAGHVQRVSPRDDGFTPG